MVIAGVLLGLAAVFSVGAVFPISYDACVPTLFDPVAEKCIDVIEKINSNLTLP